MGKKPSATLLYYLNKRCKKTVVFFVKYVYYDGKYDIINALTRNEVTT